MEGAKVVQSGMPLSDLSVEETGELIYNLLQRVNQPQASKAKNIILSNRINGGILYACNEETVNNGLFKDLSMGSKKKLLSF